MSAPDVVASVESAEAAMSSRYPCPVGCEHADNYDNHELALENGRAIMQHSAPLAPHIYGTVMHDLSAGVSRETPDPEPADVIDVDLVDDEPEAHDDEPEPVPTPAPRPVTGIDGKTYQRPEPKAPVRHRKPYLEDLARAVSDLSRANEKVVNLMGDDRLPRNAEEAAAQNRSDLCRIRDAVQGVIDRLA